MASEHSQPTPDVYDQALQKLEALVSIVIESQGSVVKLKKAELNLLAQIEVAHRLMRAALRAQNHRLVLEGIFGGSCVRISRTRAVLEVARFSDTSSHDQRLHDCFSACESVERVLQDLGLGYRLRQSLEEHRILVKQRFVADRSPCWDGELNMAVHTKMLKPTLMEEKPFVFAGQSPTSKQSCDEEELETGMIVIDLLGDREISLKAITTNRQENDVPISREASVVESPKSLSSVNPPEPEKDLHIRGGSPKLSIGATTSCSSPVKESSVEEEAIFEPPTTSEWESTSSPKDLLTRVEWSPESSMANDFVLPLFQKLEHGRSSSLVPPPSNMPQAARPTKQFLQLPVGSIDPWSSPRSWNSPRSSSNGKVLENITVAITPRTCVGAQHTPRELPMGMSTKEFVTNQVVSSPTQVSVQGLACVSPHRFHSPSRFHSSRASLPHRRNSIAVPVEVIRQESMPKSPVGCGHHSISRTKELIAMGGRAGPSRNTEAPTLLQQMSGMRS